MRKEIKSIKRKNYENHFQLIRLTGFKLYSMYVAFTLRSMISSSCLPGAPLGIELRLIENKSRSFGFRDPIEPRKPKAQLAIIRTKNSTCFHIIFEFYSLIKSSSVGEKNMF